MGEVADFEKRLFKQAGRHFAEWRQVDLHNHTPASFDYGRLRPQSYSRICLRWFYPAGARRNRRSCLALPLKLRRNRESTLLFANLIVGTLVISVTVMIHTFGLVLAQS